MLDAILGGIGKVGDWMSNSNEKDNDRAMQREIAQKNLEQQREFAQQGIRWKVADAKAAGLHPLAALGAQTSSFSPISVGSTDTTSPGFGDMGQSLGRALEAKTTDAERVSTIAPAMAKVAQTFQLERMNLENEVLKSDIALKRAQLPPPMPGGSIPIPTPGPPRSHDGLALGEDDMKQKQGDAPGQAYSRPFGYRLDHYPGLSDAQSFEDRYGDSEVGSMLKGLVNQIGDHLYTFGPDSRAAGWDSKYGRSRSPTRDWYRQR